MNLTNKLSILSIVILCCLYMNQCNSNRNIKKVLKQHKELTTKVDSLTTQIESIENIVSDSLVTSSNLTNKLSLEGYKISYRNLYHNNSIVRSKIRPDDVMFDYTEKMKVLRNKIK